MVTNDTFLGLDVDSAHVVFQTAGLLLAGPVSLVAASRKELPTGLRGALAVIGLGTMAIDGWLLYRRFSK